MLLSQGCCWRAELTKDGDAVVLATLREGLPEELGELRDLRIEVPLARWNALVKHVQSDRKLLGGLLLDFANHKDSVAVAVGTDRLWLEMARVVLDATAALVAAEALLLVPRERET